MIRNIYLIKRGDGTPVAGIFMPINTLSLAERLKQQWEYSCPNEIFYIEKAAK
jgi:hypothetical protein